MPADISHELPRQFNVHFLAEHRKMHLPSGQPWVHWSTFDGQDISHPPPGQSWEHSFPLDKHVMLHPPTIQSWWHFSASHLELHPPLAQLWSHCFAFDEHAILHPPPVQSWLNISESLLAVQLPLKQSWVHSSIVELHSKWHPTAAHSWMHSFALDKHVMLHPSPRVHSCWHFSASHVELHPPLKQLWLHCFELEEQVILHPPQGQSWLNISESLLAMQPPQMQSWVHSFTDEVHSKLHPSEMQSSLHLFRLVHSPPIQDWLPQAPEHSTTNKRANATRFSMLAEGNWKSQTFDYNLSSLESPNSQWRPGVNHLRWPTTHIKTKYSQQIEITHNIFKSLTANYNSLTANSNHPQLITNYSQQIQIIRSKLQITHSKFKSPTAIITNHSHQKFKIVDHARRLQSPPASGARRQRIFVIHEAATCEVPHLHH